MKVVPAIYPEIFEEVVDKLYALSGITKFVQIIVCDGSNGMRMSWDPSGILPDTFDYEFDLQVESWKEYVVKACKMTAKSVVVHVDTFIDSDYDELIQILNFYHCSVGLTISNDTPIDVLIKGVNKVEASHLFIDPSKLFIQVNGVKNENGDNLTFDERVLNRVRVLKKLFPTHPISVSGRINPDTAGAVIAAGADRLVSSSYIFGHEDLNEAINNLMRAISVAAAESAPPLINEAAKKIVSPKNKSEQTYTKEDALVKREVVKPKKRTGPKYEASKEELVFETEDDIFLKE